MPTLNSSDIQVKSLIRNQSQVSILNKNNDKNKNDFINDSIKYYSRILCFYKGTPLNKIQQRINKNKDKIMKIERDYKSKFE